MPAGMVLGASDYIRWDQNQAKTLNGDLGSAPPSGGVSWSGAPAPGVVSIEVEITTTGVGTAANYIWFLNGVQQGAPAPVAGTITLGGTTTGIEVIFNLALTYTAGVTYLYQPWIPTSPIILGGSGLSLPQGSLLYGGVRTKQGGRIAMGASLMPFLSPARTRSIAMGAIDMRADGLTPYGSDQVMVSTPLGTQILASECDISIPSRYLHHNGTSQLLSVTAYFQVQSRPSSMPSPGSGMELYFVAFNSGGTLASAPYLPVQHVASTITWAAGHTYAVGNYILANANAPSVGGVFKALTVVGATGGSEPTWNTTAIGATTTDGGVTWAYIGGSGFFWPEPNTPDVFYAGGLSQALTINLDPLQNCTLDLTANRHAIRFNQVPFPIFVTGFEFTFGDITTQDFE